ncbi:hypothetical protein B0H14DRAFT_3128427 [Mycena olivaceomarginata]|nr:hypothetical protein B0H14DRAFT_3128427 [Mycena olivaceomarginata]
MSLCWRGARRNWFLNLRWRLPGTACRGAPSRNNVILRLPYSPGYLSPTRRMYRALAPPSHPPTQTLLAGGAALMHNINAAAAGCGDAPIPPERGHGMGTQARGTARDVSRAKTPTYGPARLRQRDGIQPVTVRARSAIGSRAGGWTWGRDPCANDLGVRPSSAICRGAEHRKGTAAETRQIIGRECCGGWRASWDKESPNCYPPPAGNRRRRFGGPETMSRQENSIAGIYLHLYSPRARGGPRMRAIRVPVLPSPLIPTSMIFFKQSEATKDFTLWLPCASGRQLELLPIVLLKLNYLRREREPSLGPTTQSTSDVVHGTPLGVLVSVDVEKG